MAAGGGTHDANAVGINSVVGGMGADPAQGAGDILEFSGIMIAVRAEAVFEDKTSEAMLVEPEGVIPAFARFEGLIAAAGADDHGRAGGHIRHRQKRRESGDVVGRMAERAGRSVGPKGNGSLHLSVGKGERREQKHQTEKFFHSGAFSTRDQWLYKFKGLRLPGLEGWGIFGA